MNTVDKVPPILEFAEVVPSSPQGGLDDGYPLTFSVAAGSLVLIKTEGEFEPLPFAELALGLSSLARGRISFEGKEWHSMNPFEAAAARGACGTVLSTPSWISSLSVPENIALRSETHSGTEFQAVIDAAATLARLVGLDSITSQRPDFVPPRDLRVLEWIRAFSGDPRLILLEYPEEGTASAKLDGLGAIAAEALDRQAGILWVTRSSAVEKLPVIQSCRTTRYRLENEQLTPI